MLWNKNFIISHSNSNSVCDLNDETFTKCFHIIKCVIHLICPVLNQRHPRHPPHNHNYNNNKDQPHYYDSGDYEFEYSVILNDVPCEMVKSVLFLMSNLLKNILILASTSDMGESNELNLMANLIWQIKRCLCNYGWYENEPNTKWK